MANRQIVLLSYVNRSGSTFLLSALNRWPEICSCPEAEILMELFLFKPLHKINKPLQGQLVKAIKKDFKLKYWQLDSDRILEKCENKTGIECFEIILNDFCDAHKPEARFIVFKAEYLIFLHKKLVQFNFLWIELIRDPRAVYYSQSNTINPYTGKLFSENAVKTSLYWKKHVTKVFETPLKVNFKCVIFENLIINYPLVLVELAEYLGVGTKPGMITDDEHWFILPEQVNIHPACLSEPITSSIKKWQHELSSNDLFIIQNINLTLIKRLNYDVLPVNQNWKSLSLMFEIVWVKMKINLQKARHKYYRLKSIKL